MKNLLANSKIFSHILACALLTAPCHANAITPQGLVRTLKTAGNATLYAAGTGMCILALIGSAEPYPERGLTWNNVFHGLKSSAKTTGTFAAAMASLAAIALGGMRQDIIGHTIGISVAIIPALVLFNLNAGARDKYNRLLITRYIDNRDALSEEEKKRAEYLLDFETVSPWQQFWLDLPRKAKHISLCALPELALYGIYHRLGINPPIATGPLAAGTATLGFLAYLTYQSRG